MVPIIFWIIVAIGVVLLDALTGSFLFVWFSVGAIGALVAYFLGASTGVQILVFLILSVITISVGYPWSKRKFKKTIQHTPLMEEKYIDKILVAEEDFQGKTRIKLDGNYWTADSGFEKINKGEQFKIIKIDGNKIIVKGENK